MKSNKVGLFCCDIFNTYFYPNENHKQELHQFIYHLEQLIKQNNLKILYFSFITTASIEYLEEAIEDIKYHLPNNIKLIEQFFYNGYKIDNKIEDYNYTSKSEAITYMFNKYKPSQTYFADDSLYYHNEVKENIIHFLIGHNYPHYYSSPHKGLKGLNEVLNKLTTN